MARSKSLPRKTVHPNKLFKRNYRSKDKLKKDKKKSIYTSTLSILIFMFFFIKYKVYKFENIKLYDLLQSSLYFLECSCRPLHR